MANRAHEAIAVATDARQLPHGIGLQVMRPPIEIPVQLFILGLIGAKRERAVSRVLQTLLQAGVAR